MGRAALIRSALLIGAAAGLLPISAIAPRAAAALDCASWDATCRELQNARQSQADAGRRLHDIQASLAGAQQKATATLAYIDQLDAQIDTQKTAIADTTAKLDVTDRTMRFTEAEIARREAHVQVREALLAQRVRAMDKHGAVDYLELVLTARGFSQLVDRLMIMQEIVRGDQRLLTTLRQDRDQVERLRQALAAQRAEQAALLKRQRDQEAQLEASRRAQQDALDYYRQLEALFDGQRSQMEAEKVRIDAQVAALQAQYDGQARGLGGGSGRFAWPERGPITQGFGCTDLLGEPYDPSCPSRHFHTGIDIGAAYGTPIGAADAGIVALVNYGWGGGYGNYVLMTHGNGYATLYGHLSAITVSAGQGLGRGQILGLEGSTGYSTGPHLHFEIRSNGAYENPLSYLA